MKPFTTVRKINEDLTGGIIIVPDRIGRKEVERLSRLFVRKVEKEGMISDETRKDLQFLVKEHTKERTPPFIYGVSIKTEEGEQIINSFSVGLGEVRLGEYITEPLIKSFDSSISNEVFFALNLPDEREKFQVVTAILSVMVLIGSSLMKKEIKSLSPKLLKYGIHTFGNTYYLVKTNIGKMLGVSLKYDQLETEGVVSVVKDIMSACGMLDFWDTKKELGLILTINIMEEQLKNRKANLYFLITANSIVPFVFSPDSDELEILLRKRGFYLENYILVRDYLIFLGIMEGFVSRLL